MRTEQSSSHCANLIVTLPQEMFPSKSPLHFAAHRDESVIVGYYTSEEVHLRSPSPLDEPRKGGCPWQEMMVLTAPVSGCVGGMPCMVRPSIWHGLHYCLRCAGVPGALEWTTAHRQVIPSTTEKIKKTHPSFTKRRPSDCASLQKFRKIQKDLFQCLDCAIIN